MDDSILIKRILAKDRRALYTFYRKYFPKVDRYIKSKITNHHDAEEVAQDCLCGFLEAIRDFDAKSSLNTFLFAIVRHKVVDYYRRKKVKHLVFSRMPALESLVSPFLTPEDELDTKMLREKMSYTFAKMIPKYRKALLFKYAEGLPVSEIACKLTTSVKSAESVLFRARKAFVKAFISI